MANFVGTPAADILDGTVLADTFNITQGGNDTVNGLAGNDVINAGATFTAFDVINGGVDYDRLDLTGNYAAGVTLGSTTLRNVEEIRFGAGFNYKIVTNAATVAPGATLKIDGYSVSAGNSLYFDGSAETNGSFLFYDGQSNDTFFGGAKSDSVSLAYNGADTVHGGGGGDVITIEGGFTNADVIDGGSGNDVLYLRGDYSAGLNISATAMTSVESLGLVGNFVFNLSVVDAVVANNKNLYVTAEGISGTGHVSFNGSAETNGTFTFRDSIGDDSFIGGAKNDRFENVYGGSDSFQGGVGDDTFFLYDNLDATDSVFGGNGKDWAVLTGDYSAGVVFDMFTINNVEDLTVTAGFDYKITTNDANVGPGKELNVQAGLGAANKLIFDGSAETDGKFNFYGGAGNDIFTGGAGDDYLDAHNGGNDKFYGGGGDDAVSFFDAFTTSDFVDGGVGSDRMFFYGNFAGGLTLSGAKIQNIESLTLGPGFSYTVTTANSLVAAGATMAFDTYYSLAGQNFIFNGAAELDGSFNLTGGEADDQLTGGAQADQFMVNRGGNDVMNGGNGGDAFFVSSDLTAADQLNGGGGSDTMFLSADLGSFTFGAQTMIGIEAINLYVGHGYSLTTNDANVGNNALLTVDGHFLGAAEVIGFNGSAETNGRFSILAGSANDTLRGGAKNDEIAGRAGDDKLYGNAGIDSLTGGLGGDKLYGGAGNDNFIFANAAETIVANFDTIGDWNAGDKINLSAIDANSGVAGDQAFAFIGAAAFSGIAGQLQVVTGATATTVKGDIDGDAAADFMIRLTGPQVLGAGSFVL